MLMDTALAAGFPFFFFWRCAAPRTPPYHDALVPGYPRLMKMRYPAAVILTRRYGLMGAAEVPSAPTYLPRSLPTPRCVHAGHG